MDILKLLENDKSLETLRILDAYVTIDEYKINLIKCKDCKLKHYSESHNLWCDIFERIMPEDGYCCFGER